MLFNRIFSAALLLALPLTWATAQDDDLYFVPKKKAAATQTSSTYTPRSDVQIIYADETETPVYTTSPRDVDEYNRRSTGSRTTYSLNGADTLYVMSDSSIVTTRSFANDIYSQGYNDGYSDGEDYAYSQRLSRFGYGSVYASPWYYSYYDPWYYDSWYWSDPYWYGWHRPYWSAYWGWYGGPFSYYGYYDYYGWHRPYYGWGGPGYYVHNTHGGNFRDRGAHYGRTPGQTGRSTSTWRGGRGAAGGRSAGGTRANGTTRSGGNVVYGSGSATGRAGTARGTTVIRSTGSGSNARTSTTTTNRSTTNTNRSTQTTPTRNTTTSRSSSLGTSTRSSGGGFGNSSGGGFSGGGRSGGGSFGGGGRSGGGRGGR